MTTVNYSLLDPPAEWQQSFPNPDSSVNFKGRRRRRRRSQL